VDALVFGIGCEVDVGDADGAKEPLAGGSDYKDNAEIWDLFMP
jgi:hypothetical protein